MSRPRRGASGRLISIASIIRSESFDREALMDHAEVDGIGQIMNPSSGRRGARWYRFDAEPTWSVSRRPRQCPISLMSEQRATFRQRRSDVPPTNWTVHLMKDRTYRWQQQRGFNVSSRYFHWLNVNVTLPSS